MAGNRAAFGVAVKNSRRNKKRTFYLVVMIALPVLVSVVTSAIVRLSYISPEEAAVSEFGDANVFVEQYSPTTDLISWIDGTIQELSPEAERLDLRLDHTLFARDTYGQVSDIDLENELSTGILALTEGSVPSAPDEVVLTEHLAEALDTGIGGTVQLGNAIEGEFRVVGLASHPVMWNVNEAVLAPAGMDRHLSTISYEPTQRTLLSVDDDHAFATSYSQAWERDRYDFYPDDREWPMPERYAFIPHDYYAAMSDSDLSEVDRLLEEDDPAAAETYVFDLFQDGVSEGLPETYAQSRTDRLSWDTTNLAETGPVIGTAVAAVILAEVAFIAGAAFATGTRRRLREIGLIGANGASMRQVRATVVGEGLVVGLVAGLLGSVIAFLLITLGRDAVQQFVDRRIDGFPFSPADILGPIAVAVVACVIAAWVPARTASGVSTLTALQGRMPVSAPKRWVIPAGLGLGAFGVLLLGVGFAGENGGAAMVAVIGAVLMIGGTAILAGPLVAWISKHAERFRVTPRIVLRDSGRQRGRAAAAVAATMVILMAPIAVLAALQQREASQLIDGLEPSNAQVYVYGREAEGGEWAELQQSDISAIEEAVPGSSFAVFDALDVPVRYPAELEAGAEAETEGRYYRNPFRMSVVNDQLLSIHDDRRLDEALARNGIALMGVEDRETTIEIDGEVVDVSEVPVAVPRWEYPKVIVTEGYAERFPGVDRRRSALVEIDQTWLESMNPLSEPIRPLWESGLFTSGGGADIPAQAMIPLVFLATMLVVLIVVATITALSAAESDNDLRTVVAVGATNSIRRRYLGLQSGLHTLLGCLLAVPLTLLLMRTMYSSALGGYVQVGAFGTFDSSELFVPWLGILILVAGLPLAIGLVTGVSVRSAPTTPPRRAT